MGYVSKKYPNGLEFFCATGYPVKNSTWRVINGPHFVNSDVTQYIMILADDGVHFLRFNFG